LRWLIELVALVEIEEVVKESLAERRVVRLRRI
jgi:hypothetical protein